MEETAKVPGQHKIHFRTLILSDLHLGTKDAQARELLDVLRGIRCDKLILNGDIIDLWSLQRKNHWSPAHTAVIRRIMKMAEKDGTKVIYLRGNHDDFIRRLIPLVLDRIELAEEHIHVAQDGRKYLCIHGDAFDTVQSAVDAAVAAGDAATIRIAAGTWWGVIDVPPGAPMLRFIGAGAARTRIVNDHYASRIDPRTGEAFGTYGSATLFVRADDFHAEHAQVDHQGDPENLAVAFAGTGGVAARCAVAAIDAH